MSAAAAPTPGPWRIAEGREAPDKKHRFIWSDAEAREDREDSSPYCIATVHERTFCPQLDANAKLIAAAPDMAEALELLTNGFKYSTEVCNIARAALSKAGL